MTGCPLRADKCSLAARGVDPTELGAGRTTTAESVVVKTHEKQTGKFSTAKATADFARDRGQAFHQIFINSASFASTCFSTVATYLSVSF